MKLLVISSDRTSESNRPINLGDAMLTDALLAALRNAGHQAVALDFGSERLGAGEPRLRSRGLGGLVSAIRQADAVVIGGGTLLQDDARDVLGGWGGLPRLCAISKIIAQLTRTPVAYYGVGCDPVARLGARTLLRIAVAGVKVWVRDVDSAQRVNSSLRGNALVGADASLLMEATSTRFDPEGPIVVALNGDHARSLSPDHVRVLKKQGRPVIFLGMSQGGLFADARALRPDTRQAFNEITGPLEWPEAFALIQSASAVWGSRMHALYAAMLCGIPMVAVSTLTKVVTFSKDFEVPLIDGPESIGEVWPAVASRDALESATTNAKGALAEMLSLFEQR